MLLRTLEIESNLVFTDNLPIAVCGKQFIGSVKVLIVGTLWASLSPPLSLFALTHTPTHPPEADCDPLPSNSFPKQEVGQLDLPSRRDTPVTRQERPKRSADSRFYLFVIFFVVFL